MSFFGYTAHVLDSNTVRVIFETPVTDSALDPDLYTLSPITGIPEIFVPEVTSVEFFDGDMLSVFLSLSNSLTLSAVYSILAEDILSVDGRISSASSYNFTSVVPSPPLSTGSYLSYRSHLDVVFNKLVNDTSLSATALIFPVIQGVEQPSSVLTLVIDPSIPKKNLRFMIPGGLTPGDQFIVRYLNVTDSSFNTASSGEVFLDVHLLTSPPWSYSDLSTPSVISARVDRVVPPEDRVYVGVFFNCPMLDSDISDVSNWTVTKEGVHLSGVSSPVVAPDAINDATLISLCSDLNAKFNSHLTSPDIHYPVNVPPLSFTMSVVGIINDILEKFNSHIVSVPQHAIPDRQNALPIDRVYDVELIVLLSIVLKIRYNNHIIGSHEGTPYHLINDSQNFVVSPFPISLKDVNAAAAIADELKTKLLVHELGSSHYVQDTANRVTYPYSIQTCVYPFITNVFESISFLNEIQLKYKSHLSTRQHLYTDDFHDIEYQDVIDQSTALSVSTTLKNMFNGHILSDFPVDVESVSSFSSSITSAPVIDSFTYLCRLELKGKSYIPKYTITASLNSEDLVLTPFNFETETPGITDIMSVVPGERSLSIRASSGLTTPRLEDVVISNNLPVNVTGLSLGSSIYTMRELIEETMDAFRTHLTEYGMTQSGQTVLVHESNDTYNYFDDSYIPEMNEASIISSLNFFKTIYNRHASNATSTGNVQYHVFQSPVNTISTPDATDWNSALKLASVLNDTVRHHRHDLTLHLGSVPELQFAKVFDTIVIDYDGLMDGSSYDLDVDLKVIPNDPYGSNAPVLKNVSTEFKGISSYPFVAAAVPIPGAGRGSPEDRLVRDKLDVFFSKSMHEIPVLSSFFTFIGPSGLIIGESVWSGSRNLRVQVKGMKDSLQYSVDVGSLKDSFGNPIQP